MLSKDNKPNKSPIIKTMQWIGISAVSVLLIVYFLVIDTSGGKDTPIIGTVNGTPIYYSRDSVYGKAYLQLIENYRSFGINPDGTMLRYIEDIAFRNAVATVLLDNLASKNIIVSDNFIVDAIRSQFVDSNGFYNQAAYDSFVKTSPPSEKMRIQKDVENSILNQTIQSELFGNIKMSSLEFQREYTKSSSKRDIEIAYINVYDIVNNAEIDESTLNTFFENNKTNFAQADISWITVESGGLADSLYKDISSTIKNDISYFDKAAKENSIDSNNIRLGYVTQMELPSLEVAKAVFGDNKPNTLLKPIYANDKYYIILIHGIRIPEKLSEVKTEIIKNEYLKQNLNRLIEEEKLKQDKLLKETSANINSLIELQNKGVAKYYRTGEPFYYNQGRLVSSNGEIIPESSEESFYRAVFSIKPGESSTVLNLENGVALIRVISEETADMSKLSKLSVANRKAMKRQFEQNRVNRIHSEWVDKAIASARVKRKGLR